MEQPNYTREAADEICQRLTAGESLTNVCEDIHLPDTDTVMRWFMDDVDGFQERYLTVLGEVVSANVAAISPALPSKAIAAQVLAAMGTEKPEEVIEQLAAAGCLSD